MITQSDYDDDDGDTTRSETPTTHDSEDKTPVARPESSSEQLQIAVVEPGSVQEGDADGEEEDEFAEEDAWLAAGHFFDDTERDPEKYVPQLMDARAMRQLRSSLRKSEQQIETCGRMREFAPRKPAVSPNFHGCRRNPSRRVQHQRHEQTPDWNDNNNNSSCDNATESQQTVQQEKMGSSSLLTSGPTRAFLTAVPSTAALETPRASHKKQDFAVVLRRELQQVRGRHVFVWAWCAAASFIGLADAALVFWLLELEARYEETKRMLLEQMDVICSIKPSERTGGPETYEKLADLMAFVRLSQAPATQDS